MLIVDDEESIVFAMRRFFQKQGFLVDSARELEEAEALLTNSRYDVVIGDLRLTGIHGAEGLEMISFVREHCPWTKTILLTAFGTPEIETEARNRGLDEFLRKPQALPDLAQTVLSLLEATR
jgi:DNA-binding NtrC family response regulator